MSRDRVFSLATSLGYHRDALGAHLQIPQTTCPRSLVICASFVVPGTGRHAAWVPCGKAGGWSLSESFYWAFVTATTVGYGDFRPTQKRSRIVAIFIAVLGLLATGIIIALGVYAATNALRLSSK